MIIFLDTETTGLVRPAGSDIQFQPHVIEISAVMTDKKLREVDVFSCLVKPPIPIPGFITKINNINDDMVIMEKTYLQIHKKLQKFLNKAKTMVAHNFEFDASILQNEAERIGKKLKLPKNKFCTVEQSLFVMGRRMTLKEIHFLATGKKEVEDAHRAMADVKAMIESYRYLLRIIKERRGQANVA